MVPHFQKADVSKNCGSTIQSMSVLGLVKLKPRQFDFRSSAQSTRVILALTEIEVDIDGSTDASRSTGITYFQSDFFVA